MDYTMERETVCQSELIYEGNAEQPVDCDITLPEYCPEIVRVLKCSIVPGISGTSASSGRVNVDGSAAVRIIYACDDGKINCYEQKVPFSLSNDVPNMPDTVCVRAVPKTEYCNCRAVNQRRLDIHGSVSVSVRVTALKKNEVLCNAEGAGIQLRKKRISVADAVCETERSFVLNEVKELSDKPAARIMHAYACAWAGEVKAIPNKILLKGELNVHIFYCTDDGEAAHAEHTMPISQIIEAEGIDENTENSVRLRVMSLEVTPKADSSGRMTMLDITAVTSAQISARSKKEINVISDAYSTKCALNAEKRMANFERLEGIINDIYLCKGTAECQLGPSEIIAAWCSDVTSKAVAVSGGIRVSGSLQVVVLIKDGENQPCITEKTVDYDYRREMGFESAEAVCDADVFVTDCSAELTASGKIDIKAQLSINAGVYSPVSDRIISALTPDEERMNENRAAALTVYFPDKDESVWSIARKYNTTVEAIMRENGIEGEKVDGASMLLIPCV